MPDARYATLDAQHAWVGLMNCCKAQVEEIIFAELIMI